MLNTPVNQEDSTYESVVYVSIVSPAVAMIQTVHAVVHFETAQVGANFDNWHIPTQRFDAKMGITIIILACFYWPLIGLYLDSVLTSTFGIRKNPCFCLMPSYWGCTRERRTSIKKDPADLETNVIKTDQNLQAADGESEISIGNHYISPSEVTPAP